MVEVAGATAGSAVSHRGWRTVDGPEIARLLPEINRHIQPARLRAEAVRMEMTPLPFYPDFAIYAITDLTDMPATTRYALYRPGEVYMMNWTNAVIYEVNKLAPIRLDRKTALAYARFFFQFVRGRHGRFHIAERPADLHWKGDVDPALRQRAESLLLPLQAGSVDSDGKLQVPTTMIFKGSLVKTTISLAADGMVDLGDPDFLLDDLPLESDDPP
jgi:hypothetical protein